MSSERGLDVTLSLNMPPPPSLCARAGDYIFGFLVLELGAVQWRFLLTALG